MKFLSPYLNFKGDAEEAFDFYRSVFGGEFTGVIRFSDMAGSGMEVAEADLGKIAHIALPVVGDVSLMASDVVGPQAGGFNPGNNVYLYVEAESGEEADRYFSALSSDGGSVEMPLQSTGWAEKYGACRDKFQVQWMISYTGNVQYQG